MFVQIICPVDLSASSKVDSGTNAVTLYRQVLMLPGLPFVTSILLCGNTTITAMATPISD
jgi:hypothetical protein